MTRLSLVRQATTIAAALIVVAWITRRCGRPCQSDPARAVENREDDEGVQPWDVPPFVYHVGGTSSDRDRRYQAWY